MCNFQVPVGGASGVLTAAVLQETRGEYGIALNERHFEELVFSHATPPPSLAGDTSASLVSPRLLQSLCPLETCKYLQMILADLQWSQQGCHATGAHGLCAPQPGWHRRHGLHWRGVQAGHRRLHLSQVALPPLCSSLHGGSWPDMQVALVSSLLPCCWHSVRWRLTAAAVSCHRLLQPCAGADASKRFWVCAAQCAVSALQAALAAGSWMPSSSCWCDPAGAERVWSSCPAAATSAG